MFIKSNPRENTRGFFNSDQFKVLYSSSLTFSYHSVDAVASGIEKAMCEDKKSYADLCQCFALAEISITMQEVTIFYNNSGLYVCFQKN